MGCETVLKTRQNNRQNNRQLQGGFHDYIVTHAPQWQARIGTCCRSDSSARAYAGH